MNGGFEYREEIGATAAGRTVLAWLKHRYQGLNLNRALSAEFQAAASSNVLTFQSGLAEQSSYRPGHVSVITNEAPVRVMVTDASNNRIGGLASSDAFREISYGDQMVLSAECGVQSAECTAWSTLSLITKLESTSYQVELLAEGPDVFDLGIVVPDAAGTLRQVQFSGVTVVTGSRVSVTLLPNTTADYVLSINDGDGTPIRTVNSYTIVIPDSGPSVVAVAQLSPGFGPGGDKHGRNVTVL